VLGISTAGPRGRALVIPSATIERVLDPLLTTGRIERGWLGAAFYPVALPEALSRQTGQQRGLMVLRVVEGGPAASAGVISGDIVLALGSATAAHASQIARSLGPESIGQKLELRVVRAGSPLTLIAEITPRPPE
jgi:S1-C subfamily serine protease